MRSLTCAVRLAPLFAALLLGGCVTGGNRQRRHHRDGGAGGNAWAGRAEGRSHARQAAFPRPALRPRRDAFPPGRREPQGRRRGLARARRRLDYDELKRYRLADRAYAQALKLIGPTPEFLNNRGYSYLLRGDLRRASQDLSEAQAKDPENEKIRNNLKTLDVRARGRG